MRVTKTATGRKSVREALARSALYELLAWGLGGPGAGYDDCCNPARQLLAETREAIPPALERPLAALLDVVGTGGRRDWGAEARRIFTHVRSADCPPNELPYRSRELFRESQQLADINGFYRAFGFENGGVRRERPDHVAVELEFLGALSVLQAMAVAAGDVQREQVAQQAYRHFLRDHALAWMPSFAARLTGASGVISDLYGSLASLLAAFMQTEAERLHLPLGSTDDPAPAEVGPLEEESCPMVELCGVFGQEN